MERKYTEYSNVVDGDLVSDGALTEKIMKEEKEMGKTVNINGFKKDTGDLKKIEEKLKAVADELAGVMAAWEENTGCEAKLNALTEALDALEDAGEIIQEVIAEE